MKLDLKKTLQNEYLLAKVGADTAENEATVANLLTKSLQFCKTATDGQPGHVRLPPAGAAHRADAELLRGDAGLDPPGRGAGGAFPDGTHTSI